MADDEATLSIISRKEAKREKKKESNRKYREATREKRNIEIRKYYLANKERLKLLAKARYIANKKTLNQQNRDYYRANSERLKKDNQRYREKHREVVRAINRNRYARKLKSGGTHTAEEIRVLHKLQKGKCAYCRTKLGSKYHVDHIVPLSRGGKNDRRNLQILCKTCNMRKHARDPIEYAQSLGLLI